MWFLEKFQRVQSGSYVILSWRAFNKRTDFEVNKIWCASQKAEKEAIEPEDAKSIYLRILVEVEKSFWSGEVFFYLLITLKVHKVVFKLKN